MKNLQARNLGASLVSIEDHQFDRFLDKELIYKHEFQDPAMALMINIKNIFGDYPNDEEASILLE